MAATSEATTRGIRVSVIARYVEARSEPDEGMWFFVYRVELENLGEEVVQLITRHWIITDGEGRVQEVRGPREAPSCQTLCPNHRHSRTHHWTHRQTGEARGRRQPR